MKLKHRAFALLLALAMIATFMPAMAFAAPDKGSKGQKLLSAGAVSELPNDLDADWYVTSDYNVKIRDESAELHAGLYELDDYCNTIEYKVPAGSTVSYQWYKQAYDDEAECWGWNPIEGEIGNSYSAEDAGEYACVVTIDEKSRTGYFYVSYFNGLPDEEGVGEWFVSNSNVRNDDGIAELTALLLTGDESNPTPYDTGTAVVSYQWYRHNYEYDTPANEWIPINGATNAKYTTEGVGEYACAVIVDSTTKVGRYKVDYDNGLPVESSDYSWGVRDAEDCRLVNGKVELTANLYTYNIDTDEYEEYSAAGETVSYQWYRGEYKKINKDDGYTKYSAIPGENSNSYTARKEGEYACAVTINGVVHVGCFNVDPAEGDEIDENGFHYVYIEYGVEKTIDINEYYDIPEGASFQWYKGEWDEDESKWTWNPIDNASRSTYKVLNQDGRYKCTVSKTGEEPEEVLFRVEYDTENYEWVADDENATAVFTPADSRPLTVDYTDSDFDYDDGYWNFPEEGDEIIVNSNGTRTTYTYTESLDEEGDPYYEWISGNEGDKGIEASFELEGDKVVLFVYSLNRSYDHEKKIVKLAFDIRAGKINATIKSDISSMKFEPAGGSIRLYSEDVKDTAYDGTVYYSLYKRGKYRDDFGNTEDVCWINGDRITVKYSGNKGTVAYTYNASEDAFIHKDADDNEDYFYAGIDNDILKAGNNTVRIWKHGVFTSFNVYMETPQMRNDAKQKAERDRIAAEEAAKDAEFNGVPDGSVPKVKSVKAKAAKKSIKVTWTKAKGKNFKKFSKVEVQWSTSKLFPRKDSKYKILGKNKKSYKITGLKKGTYYVRVANIKYVNGVKKTGKWTVKKVKVKK